MKRFSEQYAVLNGRLEALSAQIETLRQEIAHLELQHSQQTNLAFAQIRVAQQQQRMAIMGGAALSLSSYNLSGNGPSYSYQPMMAAPQLGNAAFVAQNLQVEVAGKQSQLGQLQAQLNALYYG